MAIGLRELELSEAVANGIVQVLEAHLPAVLEELNAIFTDGITLEQPPSGQIVPFLATEAYTEGGLPLIGVGDMPAEFEDDLVSSLTASHRFYVHVVDQDSDHATLAKRLRRYVRAIAIALERDRIAPLKGEQPILSRDNLGVWSLMFESVQPGPLLGDRDPNAPDAPPSTYLSWSGIVVTAKRSEVG